jgi:hypothetical protein
MESMGDGGPSGPRGIGHDDVNAPLHAMRGGVELLMTGAAGPLSSAALAIIRDLSQAIEDLACALKVRSIRVQHAPQTCGANAVSERVMSDLACGRSDADIAFGGTKSHEEVVAQPNGEAGVFSGSG